MFQSCHLLRRFWIGVSMLSASAPMSFAQPAGFVGSQACKTCHAAIYQRWSKTRMANVVVDPKTHPEAVLGDLSKPNPLVTFKIEDIAFVYGSKWKQRYFTKRGDDYFRFPAQWDVTHQGVAAYFAEGTDWWVAALSAGQMKRPTGPLCDGCHSVNYNVADQTVTEWNVGCERCHGPGSEHASNPSRANIVNPLAPGLCARQRRLHLSAIRKAGR